MGIDLVLSQMLNNRIANVDKDIDISTIQNQLIMFLVNIKLNKED